MENPSNVSTHDAQRELEQRALRNVRSLVDKLEGGERRDAERNMRFVALVLAGTAAVVALTPQLTRSYLGNRAMAIAGGTSEITRNTIAERILGLPRDPLLK
jgi:hypothetical protein